VDNHLLEELDIVGSYFYEPRKMPSCQGEAQEERVHTLAHVRVHRSPAQRRPSLSSGELAGAFTISVENANELYLESMRKELRSAPGFRWENWQTAAQFCLDKKVNLEEGLKWAQIAVSLPFIGQENFQSLSTLADLQAANGKEADSKDTMRKALEHPATSPFDRHRYGRTLLSQGKKAEALTVFELNAKKHPNVWPVNVGLARGYAAVGKRGSSESRESGAATGSGRCEQEEPAEMIEQLEGGKPVE